MDDIASEMRARAKELRTLLDCGILERKEEGVVAALRTQPADPTLLRELAELQRNKGDLDAAALTLEMLEAVSPQDSLSARLGALLAGRTIPEDPAIPTKFIRLREFLPQARVEELWDFLRDHQDDFQSTLLKTNSQGEITDEGRRRSAAFTEVQDLRAWFDGLILDAFLGVLRQLRIEPFEPGIYSCKVNAFRDGGFFSIHQDQTGGLAQTRRLAFLYYLHFPPRRFSGGELLLYDRVAGSRYPAPTFTNIEPEHNSLVVIPADCWHEVLPVRLEVDDFFASRFTYNGWIHDESLLEHIPKPATNEAPQ